MRIAQKWVSAFVLVLGLMAGFSATPTFAVEAAKDAKDAKPAAKIDLNKATEEELQDLPGVGEATAKKIVEGRPYKSVDELAKHGVRASTIAKIAPLVVQPHEAAAKMADPKAADKKEMAKDDKKMAKDEKKEPAKDPKAAADEKIDINTADAADLEELPGVGEATAAKIIKGRPYKSIDDVVKAGVSQKTADKFAKLITFGKAMAEDKKMAKDDKKADAKDSKDEVEAKVPPKKGMVWVNTESNVFHREGDRWYGKTKKGEFMTEADAIKAGARAPKESAADKAHEKKMDEEKTK